MWLIGSRALEFQNLLTWRKANDWDFIADPVEFATFLCLAHNYHKTVKVSESKKYPGKFHVILDDIHHLEFDCTENKSRKLLCESEYYHFKLYNLPFCGGNIQIKVPEIYLLWAFKRSHIGLAAHAGKTVADLIHLNRLIIKSGFDSIDSCEFLYGIEYVIFQALLDECNERQKDKLDRINFYKATDKFFEPVASLRSIPHDQLHDITCRWSELGPLYRENLKYSNKALIDMNKFSQHTLNYCLTMVQEEAIVIGLERLKAHEHPELSASQIYRHGLIKLVTDLSKGKFQDFIVCNLHLLTKPLWDFLTPFKEYYNGNNRS